ncbi:MAG: dihydroorotate dehydrogenase electron transfer subunit [Lachnospiraceae bacterium]|nr:dihydroorotate dehydrogenase electron transfer subunit [Lachnospiraceae bacterium]
MTSSENRTIRETTAVVHSQHKLTADILELVLNTDLAETARPGQFVNLYCRDGARLLPRPISISDAADGQLTLVYRVVGNGTAELSGLTPGENVRLTGCLGNGYDLSAAANKHAVLVGGGLGIPPMRFLARALSRQFSAGDQAPQSVTSVLGYRDQATVFLRGAFDAYGSVVTASDDGSVGLRGTAVDAIRAEDLPCDVLFACGPMPMLRALAQFAEKQRQAGKDIRCYVSLEERMACGIGACLGCVTKTTAVDEHSRVRNARICVEGPVFDAEAIAWEPDTVRTR